MSQGAAADGEAGAADRPDESTASSAIGRSYATAAEPGGSLRLQRRQLQSPERAG